MHNQPKSGRSSTTHFTAASPHGGSALIYSPPENGRRRLIRGVILMSSTALMAAAAHAGVLFSTGDPDGLVATGSRPPAAGQLEIEAADDFVLSQQTAINAATFTGLIPSGAALSSVTEVVVEIYRVFPSDSANPPDNRVPTRANSPSDVALDSRDSAASELTFSASVLSSSFTAGNSVLNGINPKPNQTTMGEGRVTGQEVRFGVNFATPFDLPAGHYFFIPQVQLSDGQFYWLSAPKPITSGTPFNPDLQTWIRNEQLAPDWLRVGSDILGAGAFNASFSLSGDTIPDGGSPTVALLSVALVSLIGCERFRRAA
jgi:hypothetical protein